MWEKVSPKATDEGCSSLATSLKSPWPHFFQHPSSVSALRADPPSPSRGEGKGVTAGPRRSACRERRRCRRSRHPSAPAYRQAFCHRRVDPG
ncbi:hypothetical protein FJ930_16580 [Mesorhizobium sp. B2-4-15]|nr:hypothetical protein FJ930_16580 [Mesorhizobium sp. B2-4-15]